MRNILFRGKPVKSDDYYFFSQNWKNYCKDGFVYGSLVVSYNKCYICVSAMCNVNCCINNGITSMIEVIPETVGQYTGLTDKNGKKIFEEDIIRELDGSMDDIPRLVRWDEVYMELKCPLTRNHWAYGNNDCSFWLMQSENIEIIGNIHDNPELLGGEP